jgi:glucan phosphoethanolaminetransferase (alkaline phosphatase superfamily)
VFSTELPARYQAIKGAWIPVAFGADHGQPGAPALTLDPSGSPGYIVHVCLRGFSCLNRGTRVLHTTYHHISTKFKNIYLLRIIDSTTTTHLPIRDGSHIFSPIRYFQFFLFLIFFLPFVGPLVHLCPTCLSRITKTVISLERSWKGGRMTRNSLIDCIRGRSNNPILFLCFIHCWLWLIVFIVIYIYICIYIAYLPTKETVASYFLVWRTFGSSRKCLLVFVYVSVPVMKESDRNWEIDGEGKNRWGMQC